MDKVLKAIFPQKKVWFKFKRTGVRAFLKMRFQHVTVTSFSHVEYYAKCCTNIAVVFYLNIFGQNQVMVNEVKDYAHI